MYLFTEAQLNNIATQLNYNVNTWGVTSTEVVELRNPATGLSEFFTAVKNEDGKFKLHSQCSSFNDNLVRRFAEHIEYSEIEVEALSYSWTSLI